MLQVWSSHLRKGAAVQFQPRKKPQQARSAASVEAILQATIQVLLQMGKVRLTTTRVAERAGVSVGTLYQYFPNKSALLQALLRQHLEGVAKAVEAACVTARANSLAAMAEAVVGAFVWAKFNHLHASAALYAVSDDVEGKQIAQAMHRRVTEAMTALLATAPQPRVMQPELVAATVLASMAGVSRAMLEQLGPKANRQTMQGMEAELVRMVRAYLEASAGKVR